MRQKFIRNIIFSKTPLEHKYRFNDLFQIYPLNLGSAPNSKITAHFPLIIEYWFDLDELPCIKVEEFDSGNAYVAEMTAQTNRLIELTNLLSSVTNHQFFFYRSPETFWSVPVPEKKDNKLNNVSSVWSASQYYYPNIGDDLKIERFSDVSYQEISLIPKSNYYYNDPFDSKDKVINFPDSINDVLNEYIKINDQKKEVILSAIYQICSGLELLDKMKSLSFFSFVSAIETLVNFEFRNESIDYLCSDCKSIKSSSRTCQKCGSPIWGITAKYREFLYKYVSEEPEAKKMYNSIYNIRSKITHTEYLMKGDQFLDWDFSDKSKEVRKKHYEAMQLARRSLTNWILTSNK